MLQLLGNNKLLMNGICSLALIGIIIVAVVLVLTHQVIGASEVGIAGGIVTFCIGWLSNQAGLTQGLNMVNGETAKAIQTLAVQVNAAESARVAKAAQTAAEQDTHA